MWNLQTRVPCNGGILVPCTIREVPVDVFRHRCMDTREGEGKSEIGWRDGPHCFRVPVIVSYCCLDSSWECWSLKVQAFTIWLLLWTGNWERLNWVVLAQCLMGCGQVFTGLYSPERLTGAGGSMPRWFITGVLKKPPLLAGSWQEDLVICCQHLSKGLLEYPHVRAAGLPGESDPREKN